jgi:malonyl CoA-acyl carrier protein transacylase/SAM-dependent methyltransferase/acyl carrier protein
MERPEGDRCIIGSVKTNIGHLESAAGIAGLIKVALSLKNQAIPPSLHFENPNLHIPFDEMPIKVQRSLTPWPKASGVALAGVSSFGFGGTNSHVVLQEPPVAGSIQSERGPESAFYLLPLSAHSSEALSALARDYRKMLSEDEDISHRSGASLRDLCYTAGTRRTHHNHRLALVAGSRSELIEQFSSYLGESPQRGLLAGKRESGAQPRIAFVFSGQGQHWTGMGRRLLEQEPLFRSTFEKVDELFGRQAGWSLIEELVADRSRARFDEPEVIQPIIFTLQVALSALWQSWGIEPEAVVGHSIGEIAAAHVAGALTLDDAISIIFHRSRLMQQTACRGGMAAIGSPIDEAERLLAGYGQRLSIAAINGPKSITISGELAALNEVLQSLEKKNVFCRLLPINIAYHSHQVEPLLEPLVECLEGIRPETASIPIFSTVTGEGCRGQEFGAAYWGHHLRETVRFAAAIEQLAKDGYKVFLEIGAHPVLATSISECLQASGNRATNLPSLRREEDERTVMLRSLGALYTMGFQVGWSGLYPDGRCVQLPKYPWQRKRYWYENPRQTRLEPVNPPLESRQSKSQDNVGEIIESTDRTSDQELKKYYAALSRKFVNDSVGDLGKDIDQADGYLRFVPFSETIPGFSWISTWFEPEGHRDHFKFILDKHEEMRRVLFRGIDLSFVTRCLDIGCGNSSDLIFLAKEYENLKLHGYNISLDQIEIGNRKIEVNRLRDRIEVFNCDSSKDEFPGSYELIMGFQVIHHIKDKQGLFSNIGRHLENGGFLVLAEIVSNMASPIEHQESSAYFIPKRQWAELLANNNLRIINCVDMSREIGNFLYDPNFSENLSRVARGYDEVTKAHLAGPDRLGELFRRRLASYLALTIQKDRYSLKSAILSANEERLNAPTPYSRVLCEIECEEIPLSSEENESASPAPVAPQNHPELTKYRLLASGPSERQLLLESYYLNQVSAVLRLAPSELDPEQPINSLGLDSLMALELKNQVEFNLGVTIPIAKLLEGLSIAQLINLTLEQLPIAPVGSSVVPALLPSQGWNQKSANFYDVQRFSPEEAARLLSNIDQLSDEEVSLLLSNTLVERESDL